jgi:cation transport regulator ChaC
LKKSLLLVLLPLSLYAHERITLFKSDITVNTDASMLVRETIKVVSEQKTIIHGIVREFPTRYRDYAGTNYNVGFELLEITQDGASVAYHVNDAFNGKKIYIGSKYEKVQPGEHSYMISYKTNRQLGFYDKFDELYWNVTGSGWRLPIEKVEAIVHVPQGTPTASIKVLSKMMVFISKRRGPFNRTKDLPL